MPDDAPAPSLRILKDPEVEAKTGLGSTQRRKLEDAGDFPSRVVLSDRRVGWLEHEVDAWIRARMEQRQQAAVTQALRVARMPPAGGHAIRRVLDSR
jgi:prophage regulatory protein